MFTIIRLVSVWNQKKSKLQYSHKILIQHIKITQFYLVVLQFYPNENETNILYLSQRNKNLNVQTIIASIKLMFHLNFVQNVDIHKKLAIITRF